MGNGRGVLLRLAVHHVRSGTGGMTTTDIINRIDELIAECKKAQDDSKAAQRKLDELKGK